MRVIPAIDLMGGRCVRLVKGEKRNVISYGRSPEDVAVGYMAKGARIIHVVDLDGAFTGEMKNLPIIASLASRFPIQVGGGIRSEDMIDKLLAVGVKKVVVSTILMKDKELAARLKKKYYGRLVGSLDFKDGKLGYAGWTRQSGLSFEEVAEGLAEIVVTDTSRDGTFGGPNLELLKSLRARCGARMVAAGGIRGESDLKALAGMCMDGAIVGRALLENRMLPDGFWISASGLCRRIIPCLDVKEGRVVKGVNFVSLRDAGDPAALARAYYEAGADELVFLDISASVEGRRTMVDVVRRVAREVFIPLTVGGGI
ncbi:TPA: hypothetical protein EYP38_04310, partial [Candidatus Micrarchaeota archaeon]|nr:hypothetical protein [Candidatus Micrarchaeota archaeon]